MPSELNGRAKAWMRALCRAASSERAGAKAQPADGRLRSGEEDGQSLVEFALILPVFLLLITGLASIALGLIAYEQLGEATFAGSQIFQNGRGMLSNGDPCATAASAVTAALPNWNAANFTYTVSIWSSWTSSSSAPAYKATFVGTAAATCPGAYNDLTQYQPATLSVSYQYVWSGIYLLHLGTGNITQAKTVLVE